MATLSISLVNTTQSTVYATITGSADDHGGALCLIQSDGVTPYYPPSPSATQAALAVNCTITLGQPGSTTKVTIPHLSGARVWFSIGRPLTFLLNPGPGLVEPSVTNPTDPNINILWGFCELTFNTSQLFANISYVDFVALPIALSLTNKSGQTSSVKGLPQNGLATVCTALQAQTASDGHGWNKLIVTSPSGQILRALSPNQGQVLIPNLFSGYFEPYIASVWSKYASTPLKIDTQASFGVVTGTVSGGVFKFPGVGSFTAPSTADILTCSTGPFLTNTAGMAALTPRLSAALNRSTLLSGSSEPSTSNNYYLTSPTNHYSRILHATNLDGRGYAFPYDDVAPTGGADQSGSVFSPTPSLLQITIGGNASSNTTSGPTTSNPTNSTSILASSQIKGASYTSSNNVQTQPTTDVGGGSNVGWIANGSWIGFASPSVNFGTGLNTWRVRVASGAATGISGLVQLVLDNVTSKPLATFSVANTGGWQNWVTIGPVAMSKTVIGVHAVYLVFASGQSQDFVNVDWFTFGRA